MRNLHALLACVTLAMMPAVGSAQRVPFFTPSGTAFDPEVGVVNSGQVLDAQVAVSNDLKYVTINTRASSSRLLALRDFTFVGSGVRRGFVGSDNAGGGNNAGANGAPIRGGIGEVQRPRDRVKRPRPNGPNGTPDAQQQPPALPGGILARPGMTRVARFED